MGEDCVGKGDRVSGWMGKQCFPRQKLKGVWRLVLLGAWLSSFLG